MKKHLIVTPITGWSPERWLKFRIRGLGASEVGTIMGLNQYKSEIELFYEKLNLSPNYSPENIAKFMGHFHEDGLANLWQYWDGTVEGMMRNYRDDKIIRKCQRVNAYIQNPDYPWLFISLDRRATKGERGEEGAVELKTIAGGEAAKWETGIPPSHLVQVITQMMVCEFQWGELMAMRDGRYIDVWPFEFGPNAVIAKHIAERTKNFWDRVERGRMLLTQEYEAIQSMNMRKARDLRAELESLEPEPDGSEAYEKFMKTKYRKSLAEIGLIKGTDAQLNHARELLRIKDKIKALSTEAQLHENTLKRAIGEGQTLDFGKDGQVTWRGEPRRFSVKLK